MSEFPSCALCHSQWGDHWEVVEAQSLFFCCTVCAKQYRNLVNRVKQVTGWEKLDSLKINTDFNKRVCIAKSQGGKRRFEFQFNSYGDISLFAEI